MQSPWPLQSRGQLAVRQSAVEALARAEAEAEAPSPLRPLLVAKPSLQRQLAKEQLPRPLQ